MLSNTKINQDTLTNYALSPQVSGFSQWLGNQLAVLGGFPEWALCLIVTIVACLFTECTSNVATASLFIPIIAELVNLQLKKINLLTICSIWCHNIKHYQEYS